MRGNLSRPVLEAGGGRRRPSPSYLKGAVARFAPDLQERHRLYRRLRVAADTLGALRVSHDLAQQR